MEYTKLVWGVIALLLTLNAASALPTSILQINDSTIGITPGKTGVIILSFSNAGNDIAYDTRVVLKSINSPLTSDSLCNNCLEYSNSQRMCLTYYDYCYTYVGDVYGGNGQDTSFKINVPENTESGVYVVEFEIHYGSKNTTTGVVESRRMTRRLALDINSVNVKPDINVKSITTTDIISPGDEFNMTIVLENSGEIESKETNLELITSYFKVKGKTNKVAIGDLGVNKQTSVTYTLLADAALTPGVYEVEFNTTYSDNENSYSKTSNTGILIDGVADFNVFIQDISPDIITINSELSTFISIANIGIINARSVSVEINPNSDIELGNNNEDFLGDLDAGDFTTTSFSFTPKREGELNIILTVKYTTPNGEKTEFNSTERIIIRYGGAEVKGMARGFDLTWLVYGGIAVVVVYFFIKKFIKKKKK